MKKSRWRPWCTACVCSLCCVSVGGGIFGSTALSTAVAEEKGYEWGSVEIISIAPPFTYSSFDNVSFQVFFDKDITGVNYKHLAAGAEVLKTASRNDNPNMTHAIIDSLDESGVLDSMNDCIAFNGKMVREWQQSNPLACMVQVGELGVNNSMNIDFNGSIPQSKITDLNQAFTFTFYEGLKFPSGVELKETITWRYDPEKKIFNIVETDEAEDEAGFTVYYNGQKITKENNLVTIYDKKTFNLEYLSVYTDSVGATTEIQPQFETLSDGYNYVLIKVKAKNRRDFEHLQVVFDLQQLEEETSEGCSSTASFASGLAILPACVLMLKKRGKRA